MRRADDLNRHPCSPSLGARLADLRQEHWRHPNVRRGGPFQDRASWCGDFSASRIQDGNPFRARHEVGSGVLRFRPTLCWREMDSDFRFLGPATRPSNRHGRRDCCLGKGERIWCGTKGSNPSPSSGESWTNHSLLGLIRPSPPSIDGRARPSTIHRSSHTAEFPSPVVPKYCDYFAAARGFGRCGWETSHPYWLLKRSCGMPAAAKT